jgi:hypothetical protein
MGRLLCLGALREGDEVSVLGVGFWEPARDPSITTASGYRDTPMQLVMQTTKKVQLLVAGKPSTGAG